MNEIKAGSRWDNFTKKHNPKIKVLISIYPALAAVLFLFFKEGITKSTYNFKDYASHSIANQSYSINYWVSLYWIILIGWIYLYFKATFNESDANKQNIKRNEEYLNEINASIHNAPNPNIFSGHKLLFNRIVRTFQKLEVEASGSLTKDELIRIYNKRFKFILLNICRFTKTFSQKQSVYGANLMRYIPLESNEEYIQKLQKDKKAWVYYKKVNFEYIAGVLHVIPALITANGRTVPPVTLPLFKFNPEIDTIEEYAESIIPGACYAFFNGESVITDTNSFDQYSNSQKDDAKDFFKLAGKDVSSIICISIPAHTNKSEHIGKNQDKKFPIIGILNIDCNTTYPLGSDRNYAATYFSLLRPIAYLFSPHLEKYFALLSQ